MTHRLPTLLACIFLSACATQTPRPAPALDWTQVEQQVRQLTTPSEVQGPLRTRADARTAGDLWSLSWLLEQNDAENKQRLRDSGDYFLGVIKQARQLALPPCTLWLRVRAVDCRKE